MKIILLRALQLGGGILPSPAGSEVEIDDLEARELIDRGLATAVEKAAPRPKNKMAAKPSDK